MQCWLAHVWINETQKFLLDDTDKSTHVIIMDDPSAEQDLLVIPLMINGITSYFVVQQPTS